MRTLSTDIEEGIGYKKCENDRIVKMRILGKNNEDRPGISDRKCAQFRCGKVEVLSIYDMCDNNILYDFAISKWDSGFVYKVGKIAIADFFDPDLAQVCSNGIHYFLTEFRACYFNEAVINDLRLYWGPNGTIYKRENLKNGKLEGLVEIFYASGLPLSKCEYSQGKMNGVYEEWNESGVLVKKLIYKDGALNGKCQTWHRDNGEKHIICEYRDDKYDDFYESFYPNGQMEKKYFYLNGKQQGECKEWYQNGHLRKRYYCCRGKISGRYEEWKQKNKREGECEDFNEEFNEYEYNVKMYPE